MHTKNAGIVLCQGRPHQTIRGSITTSNMEREEPVKSARTLYCATTFKEWALLQQSPPP